MTFRGERRPIQTSPDSVWNRGRKEKDLGSGTSDLESPDIPDTPLTKKVSGLASRSAARRLPDIPDGGMSGVSGMSGIGADDAHPLDWYPQPDDDPQGVPIAGVEAWMTATELLDEPGALRSLARRLESAPWHPSMDLAVSLARAAALALESANGHPRAVADVRRGLLAAEELFRLRGSRLVESNLLVAQRIRTEWELGQILRETPKRNGARPADAGLSQQTPSLRDLGVSKWQSMTFQKVASIDLDDLDHWIEGVINDPDVELSTAVVLDVLWRE